MVVSHMRLDRLAFLLHHGAIMSTHTISSAILSPEALTKLRCALMGSGQGAKAVALAKAAFCKATILRYSVPRKWYFHIVCATSMVKC